MATYFVNFLPGKKVNYLKVGAIPGGTQNPGKPKLFRTGNAPSQAMYPKINFIINDNRGQSFKTPI